MINLIYFLLIGLCAGWLAGVLTKRGQFSWAGNLVVGVVGAILGGFLFGLLGLAATNLLGQLITATIGAILLLALLQYAGRAGLLNPKRRR